MALGLVAIGGLAVIVAAAAFGRRLGIAAPLLLVVIGVGYSYLAQAVPAIPAVQVDPQVILVGVLPPLLYSAAITVPVVDFRRNAGPIVILSGALVIVSALLTGLLLHLVLPDLDIGTAVALGAVVSPTDAVAATSVGRRLGLPPRLLAILEGEGLVNDATALVILKSAVAASALTAAGSFSVGGAIAGFVYEVVLGVIIGIAVGIVAVVVRRRLADPVLDTAISFVVPFLAYLPAEQLGASGVIAVVAAGIFSGHNGARYLSSQSRISERFNWRTVQFVLENGVFLLMGMQLAGIVGDVHQDDLSADHAVYLGLGVIALLIVVRFVVVLPLAGLMRRSAARSARRAPSPGAGAGADAERVGLRGGVVLGWAGMRGVVTLAAAQSLDRTHTSHFATLVLVAFTVALGTLLLQGGTLPFLIRLLRIRGADRVEDARELARLLNEMADAGSAALDDPELRLPDGEQVDPQMVERVRGDIALIGRVAAEHAEHGDEGLASSPHRQFQALRAEVLQAERAALLDARSRGAYPSRLLQRAQLMLDIEESRLQQLEEG